MRRSICYSEPHSAYAGEVGTWKFIYTPCNNLAKGARLKFDIQSKGRDIDWQLPQTNLKKKGPYIYLELSNGKILEANENDSSDELGKYEFVLPTPVKAGEEIIIFLGKTSNSKKDECPGIRAQTTSQRRRNFFLYVDTAGKGRFEDPEIFSVDIKGGELSNIRLLTPSFVAKNKRFDIVVRFEDEFGNLTNHAPDETLIELSHEHLRENLNWKLFVPETGFISLPNLYFNETGVYTIQLINCSTQQIFKSPPIYCLPENEHHLFFGLLHGESERYDATEHIEDALRYFRDDRAFHFYGVSPFESQEETSQELWKSIVQNVTDFNENERFITFLGMQWQGENRTEGLHLFVFAKDNKPILRKKDLRSSTLKKIYKSFSPKEMISIPLFTMADNSVYNFDEFDPEFERVVEIYNAWGCSECTQKEGNLAPIESKKTLHESREGSLQKALQRNFRFGFVAGGLDDRGTFANLFDSDQQQYAPGLTAITASHQTREAFFEALYERSCYATTGERIIVGFYLAGIPMGKETSTVEKPGLSINRHISGFVAGTCLLKSVEIIRNGQVIKTFNPQDYHIDFTFDDMEPLQTVILSTQDHKPPFAYYYLRVIQADGHMAWSSPIWIDYIPLTHLPKPIIKRAVKPSLPIKTTLNFDEDDDEDDDLTK